MASIVYEFPYYEDGDREFEYDIPIEDFENFIKENIPFDIQLDYYIEEFYKKSEKEQKEMLDEFGLANEEEVRDYFYNDKYGASTLVDILTEVEELSDAIVRDYEYELMDAFEDDAMEAWGEELQAELDYEDYKDEVISYWNKTRI